MIRRVTTFISLSSIARRTSGFSPSVFDQPKTFIPSYRLQKSVTMSISSSDVSQPIKIIDKQELSQIINNVETGVSVDEYVIIDVRSAGEIASSGPLSSCVSNLSIEMIADGALSHDDDIFEEKFGFSKPTPDKTIVFSCKSGFRSSKASSIASTVGYTKILNYSGGADDWFV